MNSNKYNIIAKARRQGWKIDTKNLVIYTTTHDQKLNHHHVRRLINEFGFRFQTCTSEINICGDMRFYISLPINSTNPLTSQAYDIESQRSFALLVSQKLRSMKHRVFNPFCNGLDADCSISDHMRADYSGLAQCDAICFCPGWQYSNGCKHEFLVASDMRLKMYVINNNLTITEL